MYVVLARSATQTMVWIGCEQARPENDCRTGDIWRLYQLGRTAGEEVSAPRKRAGRKEAPSMVFDV